MVSTAVRAFLLMRGGRDRDPRPSPPLPDPVSQVGLAVTSIILPDRATDEGVLIASTTFAWRAIAKALEKDWTLALQLTPRQWEEIVAGAFKEEGFDEVTLTPSSADGGRDVIAVKRGRGALKVIGSVKRYKPGNLVTYDDVRALMGVMLGEPDASKGVLTTTSDFPPNLGRDRQISALLPTRLELINGAELQQWLSDLGKQHD